MLSRGVPKSKALPPNASVELCAGLTFEFNSPNVSTVILGASKPQQVVDNCKALELLPKLTPDIMEEIEGILQNRPKASL